jgi:hypothetical protein
MASAYLYLLDRDELGLADAISGHEHDRMPWLTSVARQIGSPLLVGVLEVCASSAPDDGCRDDCRLALRKTAENPGRA